MNKKRTYTASVFGDLRLDRRFENICGHLSDKLGVGVPEASLTRAEAKSVYRFWDNQGVKPAGQIARHFRKVEHLVSTLGLQRVLQLSDTVELDYTGKRVSKHLGPLSYLHQRGLHLHNSLLVSDLGRPLGLLRQSFHHRCDEDFGKGKERAKLPMTEKESYRWVEHLQCGQSWCEQHPEVEMVYVADCEADTLQLFAERRVPNMHFVVRSKHDRLTFDDARNLSGKVGQCPLGGTYELQVMHSKTRQMRPALIEVRFCPIALRCEEGAAAVQMYLVDVQEVGATVEKTEVVHWRLLTTLPVLSFEQAMLVVHYYVLRWLIERLHFLLKSGGAKIEELQLATPQRLENAITTYSIAAMDAFSLRYLAEKNPDVPIYEAGISPLEHQVLYEYAQRRLKMDLIFDPQQPPTIPQYCITLGRIAGFFPSKRQPVPGLKILTRALEKLPTIIDAYVIFCQRTE